MTFIPPVETFQQGAVATFTKNGIEVAKIRWRSNVLSDGLSPRDALEATRRRMVTEQSGSLASDRTAKALVLVMEALAVLDGKQTEHDGIPVIQ